MKSLIWEEYPPAEEWQGQSILVQLRHRLLLTGVLKTGGLNWVASCPVNHRPSLAMQCAVSAVRPRIFIRMVRAIGIQHNRL